MLEFINRRNSDSYKWDCAEAKDKLPLWVADMDFKAAPAIIEAMQKRLDHGVFGYGIVPDEYFKAVSSWFSRKHGWRDMRTDCMIPTIGIVPAISAVLKALCLREHPAERKNDKLRVLTLTPAYNCFFSCISNMEAELVESKLIKQNGHFVVDWDDFQAKAQIADVFLFCNPHNPTGRVWTRDEISKIADICESRNLFVVSDEIHCEFTMPGYSYTPYACVASRTDNYCILTSASKAFNIAGLQCANIYVPDEQNYATINQAINIHEVCDLNPFGVVAAIAAYNKSEDWIDALNKNTYNNYQLLRDEISQIHTLVLTPMEGTYLAWIDISGTGMDSEQFCRQLSQQEGVMFNPGKMYGDNNYIRINLATSEQILQTALAGLKHFLL